MKNDRSAGAVDRDSFTICIFNSESALEIQAVSNKSNFVSPPVNYFDSAI